MNVVKFSKLKKGTWIFDGEIRTGVTYNIHLDENRFGLRVNVQVLSNSSSVEVRLIKGKINSKKYDEIDFLFAHKNYKDDIEASIKALIRKAQIIYDDSEGVVEDEPDFNITSLDDYVIIENMYALKKDVMLFVEEIDEDIFQIYWFNKPEGKPLTDIMIRGIVSQGRAFQLADKFSQMAEVPWAQVQVQYPTDMDDSQGAV